MEKMKIVYVQSSGQIELAEVDRPVPKKGEALLKIKYCGICGSDVLTYTGKHFFASYPRVPGHEFSAEIVQIEKNDLGFERGMIVSANPYFNCGKCYPCRNGKVNCCEHNETMGVQRDGAFAQYITMPIERIRDGKGLSPKKLALVEPFSIGYHAVQRGGIKAGNSVLIMGAGPIGLFAMLAAKIFGANVYVADLLDKRLEFASGLGADGIINIKDQRIKDQVLDITNGNGMDVCIEASGNPKAFLECIEQVCFGGKIILIGNGVLETTFNHSVLLKKELTVYGSRNSLSIFNKLINDSTA